MKLHEAVQQSVKQFGKQVIAERRLTNIVNDFNAYKEFPALKKVFPEIIKDGYATQIYEDSQKNNVRERGERFESTALKNARIYATNFAKEKSYKDDLVNYCFDSLLYALDLITSITEPTTKGFDPTAKNTDFLEDLNREREAKLNDLNKKREKDYWKIFSDLRSKYTKTIKQNIVIPHFLWVKFSGYISEKGEQELLDIEKDIRQAYFALKIPYDDWCKKEQEAYIGVYRVSRWKFVFDIIGKILLPFFFLALIIAYIFVAVYFDKPVTKETENVEEHVEQIEQVEEVKVEQKVEENVEQKATPPAETEKRVEKKVEQKTEKKDQSKDKKVVQKPEQKVEQTKPSATTASKSTSEQRLENNVNKSKSTGETASKSSAEDKNNETKVKKEVKSEDQSAKLEALYNQCTALVDKGNIAEAAILFNNETKGKTYDYSYGNWRYYDTKALITKSLDPWVETLIKQIARNGGRLIPKMKKKVKEVSQIFPDNYWLKVINKRESGNGGTYGQIMVTTMNEAGELVYLLDRAGFAPNPTKIERQNGAIIMTDDIKTALKLFQAYNDLTPNGEPDKNTLKILKSKAK